MKPSHESQELKNYFSNEFVQQVRTRFLTKVDCVDLNNNKIKCSNDLLYDSEDVEKVKIDDWFIRRFLVEKPSTSVDVAVKKLHDCLTWRKKFGVSQLQDSMFPAEYYKLGGLFPYMPDKEGNIMFVMRIRLNQKHPTIPNSSQGEDFTKKFIIHLIEKVLNENPNRKIGLIIDFQSATFANADLKIARFMTSVLSNYYYDVVIWGCLFEMPWLLNKVWYLIRSWLSEEIRRRIRFATRENISEFIERENLPHFLGGTCEKSFRIAPAEAPGFEHWAVEMGLIADRKQALQAKEFLDGLSKI